MIYKHFEFDVDKPSNWDYAKGNPNANGLFDAIMCAYNYHLPLMLRPDDILNTVTAIWAFYVDLNAEKFRELFVSHEGKKELEYMTGGVYAEQRWDEFFEGLCKLVEEDSRCGAIRWCDVAFSTTKVDDILIRNALVLASQQEFYSYKVSTLCGIPEVTLLGTADDWLDLVETLGQMPTLPDIMLPIWKQDVIQVVLNMMEGTEEFWQSCLLEKAYGSGSPDYKGWLKVFSPMDKKGTWHNQAPLNSLNVLPLNQDFPILINDNGNEFDIKIDIESQMQVDKDAGFIYPDMSLKVTET